MVAEVHVRVPRRLAMQVLDDAGEDLALVFGDECMKLHAAGGLPHTAASQRRSNGDQALASVGVLDRR